MTQHELLPRLRLARLTLMASFLFCRTSQAEVPNPSNAALQDVLTKAWQQVQAIKHPLLTKAPTVKPSFVDAGHGLVSAEIDFAVNAKWNAKGPRVTPADPVAVDPKRPYLFIQVSLGRTSSLSQPHVRSRGFRVGDTDYNLLITVASSDAELSRRVESILTGAFAPWNVYPDLKLKPPAAVYDFAATELHPSKVMGRLGKTLGEREVIMGHYGGNVMLSNPLVISEVDGATLKPVMLEIRGVKIKPGATYRLEGYESGEFDGTPGWLGAGAQQSFQFHSFFVVTKVIEPKSK